MTRWRLAVGLLLFAVLGIPLLLPVVHLATDPAAWRVWGEVYRWCMARTNIDIDEVACQAVMDRYHLDTKRDAVNLALRLLAGEPLDIDEALAMEGTGWDGDLEEMRASRIP